MTNYSEKHRGPAISPQTTSSGPYMPGCSSGFTPVIDFQYAVNALHWRIEQGQGLAAQLGYPSAEALPPFTEELLHPEERGKIARLVRRIGDFAIQLGPDAALRSTFILAHRMKRADGSYAKILRYLQPDAMGSTGRLERYQCFCTDVSRLPGFESVSFDVRLPADVAVSTEEALLFFADVLDDSRLRFTERELQVLRVWALTNTARDAACRLDLAPRTIEAHLKNMRRKLGVKRSVDVMLYARDRGWV